MSGGCTAVSEAAPSLGWDGLTALAASKVHSPAQGASL